MKYLPLLIGLLLGAACGFPDIQQDLSPTASQAPPHTQQAAPENTSESPGPTPGETSSPAAQQPDREAGPPSLLELAVRDLALRQNTDLNQIRVQGIQGVNWPDAGLGCPFPGFNYAQVITPGYRIDLVLDSTVYTYHSGLEGPVFLCQDGNPFPPLLPADLDQIQDGVPWKPVDPLPTVDAGEWIADPDPIK